MLGRMVHWQDLGRFRTDLTILCVRDGTYLIIEVASRGYDLRPTQNSQRAVFMPPHYLEQAGSQGKC